MASFMHYRRQLPPTYVRDKWLGTNIFVACEAANGLGWMWTPGKNTRKSIFVDYNGWSYKDIVNTKPETNETSNNINPENTCILSPKLIKLINGTLEYMIIWYNNNLNINIDSNPYKL